MNAALEAMEKYGGSFVKALAEAYLRADAENRARLKAAFPEIFDRYRHIAAKVGMS
jgi:hypothetical protein